MYFENKSTPHTIVIIIITRDPVDFIGPWDKHMQFRSYLLWKCSVKVAILYAINKVVVQWNIETKKGQPLKRLSPNPPNSIFRLSR